MCLTMQFKGWWFVLLQRGTSTATAAVELAMDIMGIGTYGI